MEQETGAQKIQPRVIIGGLDQEFARLHFRSAGIIQNTPDALLYEPAGGKRDSAPSVGERVLRSAAVVEQTFGGIIANLWDDPFEWTLPEHLSTPASILGHLDEVEATRRHAFQSFPDDSCLQKSVATPGGELEPLFQLLLSTLARAVSYQSQAAMLTILSGNRLEGFII